MLASLQITLQLFKEMTDSDCGSGFRSVVVITQITQVIREFCRERLYRRGFRYFVMLAYRKTRLYNLSLQNSRMTSI